MFCTSIGLLFCVWTVPWAFVYSAEQDEHRDFQYNSIVDTETGRYNFAYDTGNDNEIAHSLHMQYRDANGIVRGRYGYTDPRGKLRVVEYEAGPGGFVARGDVGPDQFPHAQAPAVTDNSPQSANLQANDFDLVPRPVQMAGWDPSQQPMGVAVSGDGQFAGGADQASADPGVEYINGYPVGGYPDYPESNDTSDGNVTAFASPPEGYDDRYPRIYFSSSDASDGIESENYQKPNGERQSEMIQGITSAPLNIDPGSVNVNNIDVNPEDIRIAGNTPVLQRSARDGTSMRMRTSLPYSYRNYRAHDHETETRYRRRQTHDHDAETRYPYRQTHDHDAETRYPNRQTHDHDNEVRYYPYTRSNQWRQRYWVDPDHTHAAEDPLYHRRVHSNPRYYARRVFFRDSHSMVPHEHTSPIYHNDNDRSHQHSDTHLYSRSQNYASYPATARPRQLKYIPSDKYHNKYYYWTDAA